MVFDVLLAGGEVVDGSGAEPFAADVAVHAGRIACVESSIDGRARKTIDARGLFVTPGFVDMHSHSDLELVRAATLEPKIRQGITLEVVGQDGLSYAPLVGDRSAVLSQLRQQLQGWNGDLRDDSWAWSSVNEFLRVLEGRCAVNVATLVPHATVRMGVMGMEERRASPAEIERMAAIVSQAMDEGAFGLSAGLTYIPGAYADDDELVALAAASAAHGGYYCPHHRNYGTNALAAYADCIKLAKAARVALHLPHAHLNHEVNSGRAAELLKQIDDANLSGADISLDSYPYTAGNTYLHAWLPSWMQVGKADDILARVSDRGIREPLRQDMEERGSDGYHGVPIDWEKIVVSGVVQASSRRYVGMVLAEIARERRVRPIDAYCELVVSERLGATAIAHHGNEENVREILVHPRHMVGTDGILVGDRPHPRGWGSFARFLGYYVHELGLLSWGEAIRKITSLPTSRLGIGDRGLLREGFAADLVCFNPDTISDRATYDMPRQHPSGVQHVLVNGVVAVESEVCTRVLAGQPLRHESTTHDRVGG